MFSLLKPGRIGPALAVLGGRPAAVALTGGWTASLTAMAGRALAARRRQTGASSARAGAPSEPTTASAVQTSR